MMDRKNPGVLFIEITNHCNMHCTFCPSDLLEKKRRHLDDSDFRNFMNQIHSLGLKPPVLCNVLGEPLLNKKIYGYLDFFEEAGHPVTLITNMTLLKDKSLIQKILEHNNISLALSLQTPNKKSYEMKRYKKMRFKEYLNIIYDAIEEKFKMGSSTQIEIHISSTHVMRHDPTIQADSELDFWRNFESDKEETRWINKTVTRLKKLSDRIRKKYPQPYKDELNFSLNKYKDYIGSKVVTSELELPKNFSALKDEDFWGYMFMPNVFLKFKSFELWSRKHDFIRSVIPRDKFLYIEERSIPQKCSMADNLGILANGELILCCLDYEAEMELGNIKNTSLEEFLSSEKRETIKQNAMTQAICRRCHGNVFIFDTDRLKGSFQKVDKYGAGWEPYEKDLYGVGGRWMRGEANLYVFARIPATQLKIKFFSEFEDLTPLCVSISSYNTEFEVFEHEFVTTFNGKKAEISTLRVEYDFQMGKLYKIKLSSPTFIPDNLFGTGDKRTLGIALLETAMISA